MVAGLARGARQRYPRGGRLGAGRRRTPASRPGSTRGRRSAWSATAASCTRRPTRCRSPRRSGPTCGGSGRAGCRSTCASSPGSCRWRWSSRRPARGRCWCSTIAGCRTSPAAASRPGARGAGAGGEAERGRQALRGLRLLRAGDGDAGDGAAVGRGGDRGLRAGALPLGQRLAGGRPAPTCRPGSPRFGRSSPAIPRTSRRRWRTGRRSGSTGWRCPLERAMRMAGPGAHWGACPRNARDIR